MSSPETDDRLPERASPTHSLVVAALVIVAIAALYLGAGIFVPLVLAVLVTFALAPIVHALRKTGLPNLPAVLIAVLGAGILIACIAYLIVTQLVHLAGDIPQYQRIVGDKFRDLQKTATGGDFYSHIADAIQSFSATTSPTPAPGASSSGEPLPVRVVNSDQGPLSFALGSLTTLLGPLATAAIVTVFVVFLLLEREDFRDRFLKLVSRGDLHTSTKVMTEAGRRVGRYLLVQATVNLAYGAVFGLGLFAIGIPNALLWALCTALFRYIPFVGTLIAAAIPFALAFAIDPGWTKLLETVVLFFGLEIVVTNAIEPRLYGSSTGLSALAVLVAAMFWASLWGPIGLILSTPLTVCLVVIGQYVPELKFLEILLGSQPVLKPEEQLYQRLLSGHTEEAIETAETYIEERSRNEFYDDVAVPMLRLADADRGRNGADVGGRRAVAQGMSAIVAEMASAASDVADEEEPSLKSKVLCIGGKTELDVAAAAMLAQVLNRPTLETAVMPPFTLRHEGIGQLELSGVDVLCLVYLEANPRTFVRFVKRRVRQAAPDVKIVVCALGGEAVSLEELSMALEVDAVATTLSMAEDRVLTLTAAAATREQNETPSPRDRWMAEFARLPDRQGIIERYKSGLAKAFGSSLVMLSFAEHREDGTPEIAHENLATLTDAVMTSDELMVIEDVREDPLHEGNTFFIENGVGFFAAAPVHIPSGEVIGCVSIFGTDKRIFSATDGARLQKKADQFVTIARKSRPRAAVGAA